MFTTQAPQGPVDAEWNKFRQHSLTIDFGCGQALEVLTEGHADKYSNTYLETQGKTTASF